MEAEPRQRVDRRLIIVETEAQDLASGAGMLAGVFGVGGAFALPGVLFIDEVGPAAFDSLGREMIVNGRLLWFLLIT